MTVVDVFQIVFSLSLSGSVLAGLILLCKALFRNKFAAQWHYFVWFLLIFRLLIPYAPESSLSVFNIFKPAVQGVIDIYNTETKAKVSLPESNPGVVINSGVESTGIPRQNEQASSSQETAIPQNNNSGYYGWLSIVWLIGILIAILYLALVNAIFSLRLKKGKKSNDPKVVQAVEQCKLEVGVHTAIPVFCSDQIKTPSLFGLIRPKLLLPPNMPATLSAEEMRYVFLHELSHLKRMDLWVNWLTLLLRAVYWFNPVIWFAFAKMQEDCEVACDAWVLKHINPEEHQKYGETIINMIKSVSMPRWIPVTTGMVNNKFSLRRRLTMITLFNRNSRKWSAAAIILFVLVGIMGLTSSVSKSEDVIQVPSAEKITSLAITGSVQVTVTKEEQETIRNFIDALKKARPYRDDVGTTPEFTVTLTMDDGEKILVFGGGERFQAIQMNGKQYNIQGEELTRYFDRMSMLNSNTDPLPNKEPFKLTYDEFAQMLRENGEKVETSNEMPRKIFGLTVQPRTLIINGERVWIWVYKDSDAAKSESKSVPVDGSGLSIGDKPYFYLAGNIIVLYVGSDNSVVKALEKVGTQFAGLTDPTSSESVSSSINNDFVIPGDAQTFLVSKEIADRNLFVTESIKTVYANYLRSKNDQLLKGLSPIDILRLYNQACDDKNFEIQVALINIPPYVSKDQFTQEIKNDKVLQENEQVLLESLHGFQGKVVERIVNNQKAYILLEKNGWYRMERDKNGIWKVGWMARA